MTESWRPVAGYFGLYEVSDLGRVRSLHHSAPRLMATRRHPQGARYLVVDLSLSGRTRTLAVHRLVARAFLGPRPDGMEARHLDGDATNPALANLAYGTRSQNMLDAVAHGTHHMSRRSECSQGHAFPEDAPRRANGSRRCIECERTYSRDHARRRRSAAKAAS